MKIFFDMDDTLAKFHSQPHATERMLSEGFFRNLPPYKMVAELAAVTDYSNIYILSACVNTPYCKQEKIEWLQQYLPQLPLDHIVLCNVGENKADKVGFGNEIQFLVDDYSRNITEWENASVLNIAIKRVNGFNNKSGRTYQNVARTLRQVLQIVADKSA